MLRGRRNDQLAFVRLEAGHQADASLGPAHLVPRKPETVGMPEVGLAVVPRQFFGPDDVFLFRQRLIEVPLGVVEGQHGERAVDGDRLGAVVVVEHLSLIHI